MESQAQITLAGVVRSNDGLPVGGITLKAYRRSGDELVSIGSAVTDANGQFTLAPVPVDGATVGRPVFRLYDEAGNALDVVEQQGPRRQAQHTWRVEFTVTPATDDPGTDEPADDGEAHMVLGRVLNPEGPPVQGAVVQAFHKQLRGLVLLGEDQTEADGFYTIRYTPPDGVRRVDLLVRATHPKDDGIAITSELICNAPRAKLLDLVVGDGPYRGYSEYERLVNTLEPHVEGINPVDLSREDADLLACKTDADEQHITYYIIAHRHAERSEVPAAAFYGLFRMDLPTRLQALLSRSSHVHRRVLRDARAENLIPARLETSINDILAALQQATVRLALDVQEGEEATSLAGLLTTTGLAEEQQTELLLRYTQHEGPVDAFWADLREESEVDDAQIENLQFTLQLGTLTGGYVPLVEALQAQKRDGPGASLEGFVAMDTRDWMNLLETTCIPDFVTGETQAERARSYAGTISGVLEQAFPTRSVATKIKQSAGDDDQDLVRFFENSPEFEFTANVDQFLEDHAETALDGIDDAVALTLELKSLQRVFKLAPDVGRYEVMDALLRADLGSALAITKMGKEPFLKAFDTGLNGSAETVFAKAEQTTASALTMFGKYSPMLNGALPYVLGEAGGDGVPDVAVPDLETLFGTLDFCACEQCRSVYSPAAYLVDLLQFLKQQSAIEVGADGTVTYPGDTALDVLFERRADIGEIELSCQNTNTVLPYVDLVLEVLESGVVDGHTSAYQTTWTADELSANVEHVNQQAYDEDHLAGAVYPWLLPFNLGLEEARTYLGHFGVSLHELMDVFSPDRPDAQIAVEHLELSPTQARILTRSLTPPRPRHTYWGVPAADWPTALADVPTFLQQAELDYDDLTALLTAEFVNPDGTLAIQHAAPCTTDGATLQNLTKEALGRSHRFLRLQRALGWTIRELDDALTALDAAELTLEVLVQLSHIQRLHEELNVPRIEMLSWWSTISTRVDDQDAEDRSLYEQLFLNNAVLSPVDPAFELNADRTELAATGERIGDHAPVIVAALEISEEELSDLLVYEGLDETSPLSLDHLSRVYRNVSLADALDLSVDAFLSVRSLTAIDPFAGTRETLEFTAKVQHIGDSGFDVNELDYLLRHAYEETDGLAPIDSAVTLTLDEIRDGLATIAAENTFTPDPTGEITRSTLALVLEEESLETATALLDGTTTDSEADQKAFIDEHFALFLDPADAKTNLVGSSALADQQARYEYVLDPLLAHLRTTLSEQLVVERLADALDLDVAVVEGLLTDYVTVPSDPSTRAIDALLNLDPDVDDYTEDILNTYRLLDKIATVLVPLATTAEELPWVFEAGPTLGWIDLATVPLDAVTGTTPDAFEGWERLVRFYDFHDRYTAGDTTVFDVLDLAHTGATQPEVLDTLTTLTGWSRSDLDVLTGPGGFDFTFPDDYRDERYLLRLDDAVALLQRLGMSAEVVVGWQVTDGLAAMEATARDIKSAVKAKYDNDAWPGVAAPFKDALREQQRDALVAYLVATRPQIGQPSELYTHFLIDVEMEPCMKTSRIKQALSSVQLFVQRCLMNLEDVELSEAAAGQWEWMKNYRVWEANRKVFLYAENWVEPDLRDDKSPFFKELENELLQSEMTEEAAEAALVAYLEKLDEVANLEVCAVYHQEEGTGDDAIDILHVVGRTYGVPHVYYYRQYVDATYWTAWERIDAGIEGDHLLAVVWNRRLHLIWPLFQETTDTPPSAQSGTPCGSLVEMVEYEYEELLNESWEDLGRDYIEEVEYDLKQHLEVEGDNLDYYVETIWGLLVQIFNGGPSVPSMTEVEALVESWIICGPQTRLSGLPSNYGSKYWDIQLAWSEYKDGGWSPKKISDEALSVLVDMDVTGKASFYFKPVIEQAEIGIPWTPPGLALASSSALPIGGKSGELVVHCYDNAYSNVTYHGSFRFTGCGGAVLTTTEADATVQEDLVLDGRTRMEHMRIVDIRAAADSPLWIPVGEADAAGNFDLRDDYDLLPTLNQSPGAFRLVVPHQYNQFVSQDAFFHLDEKRSLFVVPERSPALDISVGVLQDANATTFDTSGLVQHSFDVVGEVPVGDPLSLVRTEARRLDPASAEIADESTLESMSGQMSVLYSTTYQFKPFHHPYACRFIKDLNRYGIDGLMQRSVQMLTGTYFETDYDPVETAVRGEDPKNEVAFTYGGAYVPYNWELFFHAPLLIADRLSQNQKFEEAQQWFHYIFNPTARIDGAGLTGPERYWMFYPFHQETAQESIYDLMLALNAGDPDLERQVEQWRESPFNPHLIARLRPSAYMKTVVMKYVDNLIAWGDQLFRRDTIESINEATKLYILAAEILGPYPETLSTEEGEDNETYNTLADRLDTFSNALVDIENVVAAPSGTTGGNGAPLPTLDQLYFCIPNNENLLEKWDTVADRLFKIRHCMNIEGVERSLALFEPPIDPALLVKAVASGVDLSSALSDLYAPLPHYRFSFMNQKAVEFCADVRSLGAALLTALEKQDGEELALLRAGQETQLLETIRQVKEQQVAEAEETRDALRESEKVIRQRRDYYSSLIDGGLAGGEETQRDLLSDAMMLQGAGGLSHLLGAAVTPIPETEATAAVPPEATAEVTSGTKLGKVLELTGQYLSMLADASSAGASMAGLLAGYGRREEEWTHQRDIAEQELKQIDKQIAAADIRIEIAQQDLSTHDKQIENAEAVYDLMNRKYTNQELYGWMTSQLSSLYFQSYQLAYDLAKQAQKAYEYELGVEETDFIQFGYWDSLKKGLLSGDKLHHDLRRMEAAYLDQNKRHYELTKHISLGTLDPVALLMLKETGTCYVALPEALFDLDYPGHYMRRIKSVSLTIPAVTGPYTSVNATLTLLGSSTRTSSDPAGNDGEYARDVSGDDPRFRDDYGAIQSIATSDGQSDSGLFELNFRDERYLPFEGAGVISQWELELPTTFKAFDYDTISDVILDVHYTAKDGGSSLKDAAVKSLEGISLDGGPLPQSALDAMGLGQNGTERQGLFQVFSAKRDFPSEWHRFLYSSEADGTQTLELAVDPERFPYFASTQEITIQAAHLFLKPINYTEEDDYALAFNLLATDGAYAGTLEAGNSSPIGNLPYSELLQGSTDGPGEWALTVEADGSAATLRNAEDLLDATAIDDLILVFEYEISDSFSG